MVKYGVHVSIAGGLNKAVERARGLGCSIFQIFLRNPRSFQIKEYTSEEAAQFKSAMKSAKISYAVAHCVYTQNLMAASDKVYGFSIDEFIKDAQQASFLGIPYIITHTGSYKDSSAHAGMQRFIAALHAIVKAIPEDVTVLIENSGTLTHSMGYCVKDLEVLFDKISGLKNVGLCLDTCHLFAAGYDIRRKDIVEAFLAELKKAVGLKKVKIIHVNDSKHDLGSFKDRHHHLGKGKIGLEGIKNIITCKAFAHAGLILETPKDTERDDEININTLRRLYVSAQ